MKKTLVAITLSLFLYGHAAFAIDIEGTESSEFGELFSLALENTTEIATRTRLNSDDVPAFVTILYQDELLKLGINDIYDALCLVPGVEPYMDNSGARQLIFRGEKEKGKVKLLIDGMDINNALRGSVYYYYDFPIELVERIEVIRGPGAVLYGSGAMSGVINIITCSSDPLNDSKAFGYSASYDTYRGGMFSNYNIGDLHIGIDGYYDQTNMQIKAGPDKGGRYGRSNENGNSWSVGVSAGNNRLKLTTRFKQTKKGVAFGRMYYIGLDRDKTGLTNYTMLTDLKYTQPINSLLSITARTGYSYYRESVDSRATPPPGALAFTVDYSEDKIYADCSMKARFPEKNQLLAGFRFENSQEHRDCFSAYMETTPSNHIMPDSVIKPQVARHMGSFYLNDQYHVNKKLDISFGLRYDIYNDVDNALNPRAAIIYRIIEDLNFKAMYSHSYRIPSWIELYLNVPRPFNEKPDFSNEKSDTIELGLVYSHEHGHIGFNAYWTQINYLIIYDPTSVNYTQHGRHTFGGAEFTFKQNFFEDTLADMNFSYVYGVDQDNDKLPGIAAWLGNISLIHSFDIGITAATHLSFASKRLRADSDPRSSLHGYAILDQTFTYRFGEAEVTAGMKNILDNDVKFPAPAGTYKNDYPRPGRTFMIRLSYDF